MEDLDIPVYEIVLDELDSGHGINMISLVKEPAIKNNFIALSDNSIKLKLDEDKRELVGPLLIPNQKIYRENDKLGKFYVTFSAEVIQSILGKYQHGNLSQSVNLYHSNKLVEAFTKEIWVKEFAEDKSNAYGFNLDIGTLFAKVKVQDRDFWNDYVKTNLVEGFSIELISDIVKQFENKLEADSVNYEAIFNEVDLILKNLEK
tara:strand:+ start:404 stop:1015 length:612 start_codon:yes stop_codon:yes gene_type:complete